MPQDKPQTDRKHPPRYQKDLEPDHMAGQNLGEQSADEEPGALYASDLKELVTRMQDFTQDELGQIPVLRTGTRLQQGATYLRLDESSEPFTATGDMVAAEGQWLVPKSSVPYTLWNRLLGRTEAERIH